MKYYVTNEKVRFEERETSLGHHPKAEMNLVKVYTDIEEQEIKGLRRRSHRSLRHGYTHR